MLDQFSLQELLKLYWKLKFQTKPSLTKLTIKFRNIEKAKAQMHVATVYHTDGDHIVYKNYLCLGFALVVRAHKGASSVACC